MARRVPSPRLRLALLVVGACAVGSLGSALGGCQRALFPSDLPRNQFETYDRMRKRYVPLEEPDVFGTPQPALRARLGQQQ
jgi:hypothetical protein